MNLFELDAKETKLMVQQIVSDMSSQDCSYCYYLISDADTSPQTILGKQLLKDLRGWLTPPDPKMNHNTACGCQHEGTAAWIFSEDIFTEWESSGSLLWIHGKGLSLHRRVHMSLMTLSCSGLGKEHSLVRNSIVCLYAEAHLLDQFRNHPARHHSAGCRVRLCGLFLF
jgi:hypothetical protein